MNQSNKNINYNEISHNFVKYYYELVDSHNINIQNLFKNYSCMNFCNQEYKGNAIFLKYQEIYNNSTKHIIENIEKYK